MYQNTPEWWRDEWPVIRGLNTLIGLMHGGEDISVREHQISSMIGVMTVAIQDSRDEIDKLQKHIESLEYLVNVENERVKNGIR